MRGFCQEFGEQQKVEIDFRTHDLPSSLSDSCRSLSGLGRGSMAPGFAKTNRRSRGLRERMMRRKPYLLRVPNLTANTTSFAV